MAGVTVHLVSTPWSNPRWPSIQVGCLRAYLARALPEVPVHGYSAFLTILHRMAGARLHEFFAEHAAFGETLYLLAYALRFGLPGVSVEPLEPVLDRMNQSERAPAGRIGRAWIERLAGVTAEYVQTRMLPRMPPAGVHVVGSTLNYDQVYASLFLARELRERAPGRRFLFLFGGASAVLPQVRGLLQALEPEAWCLAGEGEKKLEDLVRILRGVEDRAAGSIQDALQGKVAGLFHCREEVDLVDLDRRVFETQISSIEDLPLPDYSDYVEAIEESSRPGTPGFDRGRTELLLEGTRGCFARCDFCGLNYQWEGFRKKRARTVTRSAMELAARYKIPRIGFTDNVCDTWAEEYATGCLRAGVRLGGTMELRAHHPESFWTKLALAGVEQVQVGVESLSGPLLRRISKGTRVVQNMAAQKYLTELGIASGSYLMGHHPFSTLEDIAETRRILEATPHLAPYGLTRYRVAPGSPLYHKIPVEEKRRLASFLTISLGPELDRFLVGSWYEVPPSLALPEEVFRAWEEFRRWYGEFLARPETRSASVTVTRIGPDCLFLRDVRHGRCLEGVLEGDVARLYDLCHRGLTARALVNETGLPPERVEWALSELSALSWVLKVEDAYLSIALRPRDVLIQNLLAKEGNAPWKAPERLAAAFL